MSSFNITQPIQITSKPQKKRICFISDSFTTDTSVLRDRISIIGKLDRNKYDVYFASFYRFEEINGLIAKVFMNKIKDNYIALGTTLTYARETLEKLERIEKMERLGLKDDDVILRAYDAAIQGYATKYYGYINFGDGAGNTELSKEEFEVYSKRFKVTK